MKTVILLSGKARSGKDTVFSLMKEYFGEMACQRFAFADYLKKICKDDFGWDGSKEGQGRDLLITVGQLLRDDVVYTNGSFKFGNNYKAIHNLVWGSYSYLDLFYKVHAWYHPFEDFLVSYVFEKIEASQASIAVVTDFRFLNEKNMFLKEKTFITKTVRIERGESLNINDPSETELDNFSFDYVVQNNESVDILKEKVYNICEEILKCIVN